MTRVLVTGALGNVGRVVVRECEALGLLVRAAHRDRDAAQRMFPSTEIARFDFLDRTTWTRALVGCESLFLLRPPPIGDMKATLCPLIDASHAAGLKHVVFLSVMGADRMTWVPHHEVEEHLKTSRIGWTILRPGFFAQNMQDAYRLDIQEDARIYVPAGAGKVAFVDVADVGAVAARVLAEPVRFLGTAITCTGPTAIGFDEAAASLSEVLGRTIRYEAASIAGYAWHLRKHRAMSWKQIAIQSFLHVGLRRGDAEHVDAAIPDILGRPARSFAEYARNAKRDLG